MDSNSEQNRPSSSTDNEDEGRLVIADQPPPEATVKMINNNDLKVKLM